MAEEWWHGYFAVIRLNIGAGNWANLQDLYEAMGTHECPFPCFNNHWRTRLDGDAVIYESLFDPDEVSVQAFKELLADTFGVSVEDIYHTVDSASYSGDTTTIWAFYYDAIEEGKDRFQVERFGNGHAWELSRQEALGYVKLYQDEWDPEE